MDEQENRGGAARAAHILAALATTQQACAISSPSLPGVPESTENPG